MTTDIRSDDLRRDAPLLPARVSSRKERALAKIGDLTPAWKVYTTGRLGSVSQDTSILEAAFHLYQLGLATLAQRRTASGTEYLIKAVQHSANVDT